MKAARKIIQIDEDLCDGCGQCVPACAEGALQIIDGKAGLVSDIYCDGLGACLGECPQGALRIMEREAEEFDEEAVHEHLAAKEHIEKMADRAVLLTCPSSRIQTFASQCQAVNNPTRQTSAVSALSHWPVQIALVPPTAPFLRGADMLVAADCTPVAYPHFHNDFLKDRVLLIGCPKLDNAQAHVYKFAEIFRSADIRSVTVLDMEVPCCSKLPLIVSKGMELADKRVPIEEVVISTGGEILKRSEIAA